MTRLDPGVRQTLSSVLRPPAGFRLDAAVGTSFTLDLRTLLAVPLTFALLDGVEIGAANEASSDEETPAAPVLLSALLAYAERIRVVSDARYISAPTRPSRLYSLLEPAIKPVRRRVGRALPSQVLAAAVHRRGLEDQPQTRPLDAQPHRGPVMGPGRRARRGPSRDLWSGATRN